MKKIALATVFIVSSSVSLMSTDEPAQADCTRWHPHHCGIINDIGRELSNFERTVRNYLEQGLVPPIIREYFTYLESQARYKELPSNVKRILAREYPGVNLSTVRYAEGINTIHGKAITVGNKIYFPTQIDFINDVGHLYWLLHELEHVSQYQAHGGVEPFLVKYLVNGALEIGSNGSIDIHDAINLERDAENKANRIYEEVYISIRNPSCNTAGRATPNGQNRGDRLASHTEMYEGDYLLSGDGRFKLVMQGDGNLVIYQQGTPIWASNTNGVNCTPYKLAMQSDGNLVVYGKTRPIWASNTNGVGQGPYTLVMQNDGNLVVYDRNGSTWASNTCCR